MAKVFLSYSREDAAAAKQFAECMAARGIRSGGTGRFRADRGSPTEIDRELKEADAVVVLWTKSSVESAWVQDEAAEGRDTGRLVPVTLDGVQAAAWIPPISGSRFRR